MSVEEMFTIIMGELGWLSYVHVITVVIFAIAIVYLAYKLHHIEMLLDEIDHWQQNRTYL